MRMRRTVVLGLLTASALAWPPTRRLAADLLLVAAAHLDPSDEPEPTPGAIERLERGQRRFAEHVADALIERGQESMAAEQRHDTNGHHPVV